MELPLETRLETFAVALGEQDFITWWEERRQEFNSNIMDARLARYGALFGIDDFFTGRDPYWKASGARRQQSYPSPDIAEYTAADYGERFDAKRGLLRRVFGES